MNVRMTVGRATLLLVVVAGLCLGQLCTPASNSIVVPAPQVEPQPQVEIETAYGTIVIELFNVQAPLTTEAFLQYVDQGFYEGTLFHEVRANQSVSAGTYTPDLRPKTPNAPVANESNNGLRNLRGRVALVEPSGAGTGTSEFLINLADNTSADFNPTTGTRGRTIFGRVIEGLDVADRIAALTTSSQQATDGKQLTNLPTDRPTILSMSRRGSQGQTGENRTPFAIAGADRNIAPRVTVTLSGSASSDPDRDPLTYRWEQTAGDPIALSDTSAARPTFVVPDREGTYTFRLTVDDGRGGVASDSVTLTTVRDPSVRLKTSRGDVVIDLFTEAAPGTTLNFLQYVEDNYYNGTIFHRVMPGFVVQGGGFLPGLTPQSGIRPAIVNEYSPDRSNLRGTVAMAKLRDDPDSATSQFFFNLADNSENLDNQNGGFTVFARVVEGMEVVNEMSAAATSTQTDPGGNEFENVPVTPIVLNAALVEEYTLPATFTTTASGLQHRDLAVGTGTQVTRQSQLQVLYTGRLGDENGEVFDSSTDPEQPAEFGLSGLIPGWQEGLGDIPIRVGGRRILVIPPELGYGSEGQGSIPPNATLWFDIEVLGASD